MRAQPALVQCGVTSSSLCRQRPLPHPQSCPHPPSTGRSRLQGGERWAGDALKQSTAADTVCSMATASHAPCQRLANSMTLASFIQDMHHAERPKVSSTSCLLYLTDM